MDEAAEANQPANVRAVEVDADVVEIAREEPPKRPPTAYFLFCSVHRAAIQAEVSAAALADSNEKKGVTVIAKRLGEKWKSLNDEERSDFQSRAKQLKAEFDESMKLYQAKHPINKPSKNQPGSIAQQSNETNQLIIPLAIIRRIVKLDLSIHRMSKEAVSALTKCTELFLQFFAFSCIKSASLAKRRSVRWSDLLEVSEGVGGMEFLRKEMRQFSQRFEAAEKLKQQEKAADKSTENKQQANEKFDENDDEITEINQSKASEENDGINAASNSIDSAATAAASMKKSSTNSSNNRWRKAESKKHSTKPSQSRDIGAMFQSMATANKRSIDEQEHENDDEENIVEIDAPSHAAIPVSSISDSSDESNVDVQIAIEEEEEVEEMRNVNQSINQQKRSIDHEDSIDQEEIDIEYVVSKRRKRAAIIEDDSDVEEVVA